MPVKPIIHDQLFLQQKCKLATIKDKTVAIDLRDTLLANDNAAGLAANMIGKQKRIIAIKVFPITLTMLNPKILKESDMYLTEEGCLSLSGTRSTKRYKNIKVEYLNMNFEKKIQNFNGFAAEVIQHEIDHCNGILI